MNKRYSTKPRQFGNIGFQWKEPLPHQDILHSELKKHVTKIDVDIKQLPGLLDGEKDADWSTVTITYGYIQPGKTILEGYTEAEEIILANMALAMNDRFHFLLAITYEFHGKIQEAREEYLKFILKAKGLKKYWIM